MTLPNHPGFAFGGNFYRFLFIALLLAGFALFAGQAWAGKITVTNFSFEDPPDQGNSGTSATCPNGWICTPAADGTFFVGVYSPTSTSYTSGSDGLPGSRTVPSDGSARTNTSNPSGGYQALYISNNNSPSETVKQTTAVLIKNNTTYTLDLWIGHPTNKNWGNATIELLAGVVVVAHTDFNAGVGGPPGLGFGQWAEETLTFTTGTNDSNAGQTLAIGLLSPNNVSFGGVNFDDVTLTCNTHNCAPEPATLLLLAIGLSSLALTARRKRKDQD